MTQFDLRFQDLLRHSDWRVEPCHVWIGSSGEWASGESHQRVIHRADQALYVIPRLFRSIVSPKMRSFATWHERRELVRFARQVVRLDGLSAAWKATEPEKPLEPKPKYTRITNLPLGRVSDEISYGTSRPDGALLKITYDPMRGISGVFVVIADGVEYVINRDALELYRTRL